MKKCQHCGKEFLAKRESAKFCSDNCRKYNSMSVAPAKKILEGGELRTRYGDGDSLTTYDQTLENAYPGYFTYGDTTLEKECPSCAPAGIVTKFQTRLEMAKTCLDCREKMLSKKYERM